MNWEKIIFYWEKKWNFELIGNSVCTTDYLALGKTVLSTIYLKARACITKLLSVYNSQKKAYLKRNNFVPTFIFLKISLTSEIYLSKH